MPIIVEQLNYTYNSKTPFEKKALIDVNLKINDGEFIGIIGHTGSGKSTFVQHLNGLIRVQSGKIIVDDIDLSAKKVDLKKLRANVGMVFQYPEYQLFAETVLLDVSFGPKNMGQSAEEITKNVTNAINTVGLDFDTVKDKSPFDLSGGERRRVALAGVLAMNPKVLVLDEPTAGLDPLGKSEILNLMNKLRKEYNTTIIMVSHDMNEIYENVDRVAVFVDGTIKFDCKPEELFLGNDDVSKYGLEMPAMAQVVKTVREKGFDVNGKTVSQVYESIIKLKGGKNV